jgi:hypothetical protein
MNSSFVAERSRALAERLLRERPDRPQRIERAFQLCFNRSPDTAEAEMAEQYFIDTDSDEAETTARFCQALLSSAEFRIAD